MQIRYCPVLALVAALAVASPARSAVIADTFGPGNTVDLSNWPIGHAPNFPLTHSALSVRFTLASAATINDIAVAAFTVPGSSLRLFIESDNAGLPSNNVLSVVSAGFSSSGYIDFDLSIALDAGTYWLTLKGVNYDTDLGGWSLNSIGAHGAFATSNDETTWVFTQQGPPFFPDVLPAYRIGIADTSEPGTVPEPDTLALLGAALLGLGFIRRRNAI